MRGGDKTAANRKPATLGTKIYDRRSLRPSRWEAPPQLRKCIRPVFEPPNYRSLVGRPDVLSWLKVRRGFRPSHRNKSLAEGGEIIAIWNMVAEVVAHAQVPQWR